MALQQTFVCTLKQYTCIDTLGPSIRYTASATIVSFCLCTGEWLCWPCKVHEEEQRQQGIPQAKIRPPRWEVQGGQLQGGSKAVQCALCPVRQGAFRRTADGNAWMHEVSIYLIAITCQCCCDCCEAGK